MQNFPPEFSLDFKPLRTVRQSTVQQSAEQQSAVKQSFVAQSTEQQLIDVIVNYFSKETLNESENRFQMGSRKMELIEN